jgi:hypothetical protein
MIKVSGASRSISFVALFGLPAHLSRAPIFCANISSMFICRSRRCGTTSALKAVSSLSISGVAAEHVGRERRLQRLMHEPQRRLVVPPAAAHGLPRLAAPPAAAHGLPQLAVPPAAACELPRLAVPPAAACELPRLVVPPVAACGLPRLAAPPAAAHGLPQLAVPPAAACELPGLAVRPVVVVDEPLRLLLIDARLPLLAAVDERLLRLAPVARVDDQAAVAAELERLGSRAGALLLAVPERPGPGLAGLQQLPAASEVVPAAVAGRFERRAGPVPGLHREAPRA